MSLVSVSGFERVPFSIATVDGSGMSFSNFTMDENGDHCGAILVIPKTGTLTKIGIRLGTVTTSDTLLVALEGVDATTGRPDGTITPTGASGTVSGLTTSNTYWVSLNGGTGVSVTAGTIVAVTVRWNSYVSGNVAIAYGGSLNFGALGLPYTYTYNNTGAVWTLVQSKPNFGFEYSDGTIEPVFDCLPAASANTVNWNNTSNPDRRGLRFSIPYKAAVVGVTTLVDMDGGCSLLFYDSDGTTLLETITYDPDIRSSQTTQRLYFPFSTPRTLSIDTFYRAVILPASATNNSIINLVVVNDGSNQAMNAVDGGVNFHYTTCNGAPANEAAWTQTLTTRPPIALVLSQLDNGAGGGGLKTHPGMTGGLNG